MNDKVNIQLVVPEIEQYYNLYIPVNKKIYEVIDLIVKAISELSEGIYPKDISSELINATTREIYDLNSLVFDTNIRNGSQLVLLTKR